MRWILKVMYLKVDSKLEDEKVSVSSGEGNLPAAPY